MCRSQVTSNSSIGAEADLRSVDTEMGNIYGRYTAFNI